MRPFLVVALDPGIKVRLEFGDRAVDLLAKGDAIELVEHRLVEPLDDAIRLRALGLGARMVDILERQVELVFMVLGVAAIFRAAISQHPAEPHLPRIIERHDAIVDEIGCGDRRLAIIELGEGDLCKRRSNNPSLKRPDFPGAPEQKSGSRYPFALGVQRVGDEGRGALWARSLRGSDRGVEPSRGGATVWN